MNGLNHNALTCSAVPIPPWERSLQTVEAQPYFNVSQASLVLEGIVFDRNNNLLFVDVATGRVFKLTKGRNLKSTSLAIRPGHRELFIVANSGTEPGGAMIFRSGAFAPAPFPFSHQ
ncbi:TPA: hypothetical protein L9W62_000892 [Klebsiella pneumoniae]|nr:hypothetical protein [Klebsiella pneumoniae]